MIDDSTIKNKQMVVNIAIGFFIVILKKSFVLLEVFKKSFLSKNKNLIKIRIDANKKPKQQKLFKLTFKSKKHKKETSKGDVENKLAKIR